MKTYTRIRDKEADIDIVSCNDCGAHANKKENVQHYPTCIDGESKKWEKEYNDAYKEANNGKDKTN